jgi:exopolyphosphatase/guanosine-5'-triphosphate,3'-diphosphate pyrophosphatase
MSSLRAAALPDAAELLRLMLAELKPDGLVFSSWGLREGLLFQRLGLEERANDPLLAGVIAFAAPRQGAVTEATRLAAWTAPVARGDGPESERLRLAATLLALALARVEPNLRARQGVEWALDKRWIGIDARGRAMLAAALLGSCGKTELPPALARLAGGDDLREATGWGLAIRLARRVGAAALTAALSSTLGADDGKLTLTLTPARAPIAGENVAKDLAILAASLGLEAEVRVDGG